MTQEPSHTPYPRLMTGRAGTTTEGHLYIVTRTDDTKSATRIISASGTALRERGDALIWGFPPETAPVEIEALFATLTVPEPSLDGPLPASAEGWDFDLSAAPRGFERKIRGRVAGKHTYERGIPVRERIFAAGSCGVVTVSYWIPDQERWCMFTKAVPPMAWRPWEDGAPLPRHPLAGKV